MKNPSHSFICTVPYLALKFEHAPFLVEAAATVGNLSAVQRLGIHLRAPRIPAPAPGDAVLPRPGRHGHVQPGDQRDCQAQRAPQLREGLHERAPVR